MCMVTNIRVFCLICSMVFEFSTDLAYALRICGVYWWTAKIYDVANILFQSHTAQICRTNKDLSFPKDSNHLRLRRLSTYLYPYFVRTARTYLMAKQKQVDSWATGCNLHSLWLRTRTIFIRIQFVPLCSVHGVCVCVFYGQFSMSTVYAVIGLSEWKCISISKQSAQNDKQNRIYPLRMWCQSISLYGNAISCADIYF